MTHKPENRTRKRVTAALRARVTAFCLAVSLSVCSAFGLQTDQSLAQLLREQWQTEDGLPQNAVNCIAQDHDGFIWFGTENGLVQFDGKRFDIFTELSTPGVPDNFISSLLVARDGSLWAGTRTGGLCRHRDGVFDIPAAEFEEAKVHALAETPDGTIWVATEEGLLTWDGKAVRKHGPEMSLENDYTTALHLMPDGTLMVGTREGNVWRVSNGKFEQVVKQRPNMAGSPIKGLAFDAKENKLWIAHDGAGLFSLQGNILTRQDLSADIEQEHLQAILLDADGALWAGSQNGGLFRLKNGALSNLSRQNGFDDDVISLFQDRERSVWVGTHFTGLIRFSEGRAVTLTMEQGLPVPTVTTIVEEDADTLWVGTRGGGLWKYSHCVFSQRDMGIEEFSAREDVRSLLRTSTGELWVGTHGGGVGRFDRDGKLRFFTTADGLVENKVSALLEVNGDIWIGTVREGISIYDGKTGELRELEVPDYLRTHIRSFAREDGGAILIGAQSGLVRYEDGRFTHVKVPAAPEYSVRYITREEDGTLWVGTRDHGLLRIRGAEQKIFNARHGLTHNRIYHVLLTKDYLFLAGNQGIERVTRQSLDAVAQGVEDSLKTRLYTSDEGLKTSECGGDSSPSAVVGSDGTLWVGTREGLTYLPPPESVTKGDPPTVLVRSVTVDNRKMKPSEFTELRPGDNRVQVDYTALSLRNPAAVFFQHMLVGVDSDWVEPTRTREVAYYKLRPGKYTFRVKACNDDGIWNETGATLAFTVVPQLHQTTWFRVLASVGGAGLLVGGYRWRVRNIRARNKQLESVVAERTKELQAEVNQRTEAELQLRVLNEELESRVKARMGEVRRAYENLQIELHERQEAEQALARSEARLRRIVDSGMVGILFWQRNGSINDANETFLRMTGYTREEMQKGQISWEQLTPPEFQERDFRALEEIREAGVCTPFEKEYVRKDGTRVPILIGGASLGGDGDRGVCFVLDISKLKETEEEIRQLNLKLEARVEERTIELARTNEQLASEVQERKRVGVALASFSHLGQKLHSARTEKEAAEIVAQTAKSLIPHDVCSIELYDSDGKLSPVLESMTEAAGDRMRCSISVSIRNGSRVVGVIGLRNSRADSFNYSDANTLQALGDYCGGALERIHAEEARRETERRFSTFMTNAPALAWMKDARFRYVFTNEMFQRFIGMDGEQIVGKTDYDLWPDHVAFHMRTNDTETVKTQSKLESQEQLKRFDGETRTLLTLRFLFTTGTGEQYVAGMAVDISEQKRAEEALHRLPQSIIEAQEAERRRVARELHDGVNQAIASVKFRIQTAEQQILRSDPRWQETCSKTKDMLDSVLQQVRRLSRNLRPGELDDFGLVAAARSACQEFELRNGIHVRFDHSEFVERFTPALELSLYRIIQEGLTNVERHSGATAVEIELSGDDSYVALEITDNGCGFDMSEKTEPRADGGLGLLHMRERASLIGGVFSMATSPGKGVRISIHVPIQRREEVLSA